MPIELPAKEGREVGLVAHGDGRYTITGVNPADVPKGEPEEPFTIARLRIKRPGYPDGYEPIELCAFKVGDTGSRRAWSVTGKSRDMDALEGEGTIGRLARWSELVELAIDNSLRTYPPSGRR